MPPITTSTDRRRALQAAFVAGILLLSTRWASGLDDRVVPVEDWNTLETRTVGHGTSELHLRTGYARPLVMPEAVRIVTSRSPTIGLAIEIDREIVVLSPTRHFDTRSFLLIGLDTGRRYRFAVRASTSGERAPLRIVPN